ncbi:ATP-dependent Clp protease proteolytic subunit [Streptomyces anulatus]|uniref:ATP-dependent Clp protease proteolytic subunit n=1 Tax=Streptomyces TaxID=1883 RepID=UPI0006FA7982|nr:MULTISPECIES: ATP-dependent Clp protease proteolytic subunit [Streptomyces]MDF9802312.1 ATP-dependent Clp protease protease subunit [Streptomyces sp. HB372]KQX41805.1 ATP-dependent Clp protease proteolytic subunit [Streptomyces sp. Root1295]KRA30695.1 ATP-dependent Clp protease proteolytic subunit [Streptomyces sp. Root63]MBQ1107071.1 ATP-dependent Clp protease proteolytic subunit [Streptomyces sp. 404i]MDG9686425.1 ATP-dependent Clp protease proteolytic subunit [Streptomyces sp. DH18]
MIRPAARYVLPEFTERTATGTRTLDPYSKLLSERIVFLGSPIDDIAASDLIAQFMYLEHADPDRPLSLYINSPGGTFQAMAAVYDTMRFLTCEVETFCLGQAGSYAAALLAAGAKGRRHALPGARVVIQQPAMEEPMRGQPSDLEIHARELVRTREMFAAMLVRDTGRTAEQITADIERDTILDAKAALDYGLVDHVMENR